MKIDIAICTWNRSRLLHQTLESIKFVDVPTGVDLSIVVVNNNCTDSTESVVDSFAKHLPLTQIFEKRQGHSVSRNAAIDYLTSDRTSDLIVWTDDDVVVHSNWLVEYATAVARDEKTDFWGGPIQPVFENQKPKWIEDNWPKLKGCFAERQLGDDKIMFSESTLPYGANFAVRTSVQSKNRFATKTGRRSLEITGDDELELLRRLLAENRSGKWLPGAKVQHLIDAERATENYVYRYFFGQGRMLVAKNEPWHRDLNRLKREARWEKACYRTKRYFANSETWVSHLTRSALAAGQADALVQVSQVSPA